MKLALRGLGTVLMFFGLVWLLQGIGMVPGSFMTGEPRWAIFGAISLVAGVVLLVVATRHDRRTRGARR